LRISLIAPALIALSACNSELPAECAIPEATVKNPKTAEQWGLLAYQCQEYWSKKLARSPDSASEVADAAVDACEINLHWQATQMLKSGGSLDVDAAKADMKQEAIWNIERYRAAGCPRAK